MGNLIEIMAISAFPLRAALLLLVGILVTFEAREDYVTLIDEAGTEEMSLSTQMAAKTSANVTLEQPLSCDIRREQAQNKVSQLENEMQRLGLEVLQAKKKGRELKEQAENGDADYAGRKKGKEDYPQKYHTLLFQVKQKLLARSPAVEMAAKLRTKVEYIKADLAHKKALKYKLGNETQVMNNNIEDLKMKSEHEAKRTGMLKATLDKRTRAYEGKFQAELRGLGYAKKSLEAKIELSEKKRMTRHKNRRPHSRKRPLRRRVVCKIK